MKKWEGEPKTCSRKNCENTAIYVVEMTVHSRYYVKFTRHRYICETHGHDYELEREEDKAIPEATNEAPNV